MLVVASLLRLPFPDLTPFGHDEALEAERARPIWYGARPVDSEITSWWIPDPAGLLYFFALAEPFPQPAVARVVLVASANVASVGLAYLFARRFFGARVGLLAGLFYAVNPWAVTFGRQPWVITQPLLTTVMLLAAAMVVARRDRRWLIPFFVAGAAQTQTHLLAVLFGPPVLLTLLLFWRRWLVPHIAPAILAALAIVAPFVLHLWELRDDIAEALARGNRGITLAPDGTAATLTVWLLSGLNLDLKLGFPDSVMAALHWPLVVVAVAATLLLLVGVGVSARACYRRAAGWEADALLLIWLVGPLALMTWQSSQVYIHYVLCLVPVPFVLMARGAGWLAGPTGDGWHLAGSRARPVLVAVVAMLLVQVAAVTGFYAAVDRSVEAGPSALTPTEWQARLNEADLAARQLGIGELHGLPLRYWQSVADRARVAARATGLRDVTVVTGIQDAGARHLDKRRKALNYLLGPDLAPRFPLEGLVVAPTGHDVLYLTVPEEELPRAVQRAATRVAELPLPGTNGATRIFQVRPRPPDETVTVRRRVDLPIGEGVRLLVLDLPPRARPGQTMPLQAMLLVEDAARLGPDPLMAYVELVDAGGRVRTSVRRGGLTSDEWQTGDLLLQQLSITVPIDLPEGDFELRVGLTPADDDDAEPVAASSGAVTAATARIRSEP